MSGSGGVTAKMVDVMPVHAHYQITKCFLIGDSGDSGIFLSHVRHIVLCGEVEVVPSAVFGIHHGFKTVTKIEEFT